MLLTTIRLKLHFFFHHSLLCHRSTTPQARITINVCHAQHRHHVRVPRLRRHLIVDEHGEPCNAGHATADYGRYGFHAGVFKHGEPVPHGAVCLEQRGGHARRNAAGAVGVGEATCDRDCAYDGCCACVDNEQLFMSSSAHTAKPPLTLAPRWTAPAGPPPLDRLAGPPRTDALLSHPSHLAAPRALPAPAAQRG